MTVVVDANIIISGIINPYATISELILLEHPNLDFVTPEYAIEEIVSHKIKICKEAKVSASRFDETLDNFLSCILCFAVDMVSDLHVQQATNLVSSIDEKDIWYVAFALALDAMLWTGDLKLYRGLRRKRFSNVVTTKEMNQIIKGL